MEGKTRRGVGVKDRLFEGIVEQPLGPPRWSPHEDYEAGDVVLAPVAGHRSLLARLLGRPAPERLERFICVGHRRSRELWEPHPEVRS